MDEKPFFELNILDIKENQVPELKKFHKSVFNLDEVFDTAAELKYVSEFKNTMLSELKNPTDQFVKYFLSKAYDGQKTQAVIDRFRPTLKKSLNDLISEMMNDKIKSALNSGDPQTEQEEILSNENLDDAREEPRIETTNEELEAYFIIKNLLKDMISMDDIIYKDTENYFNILYTNNVRKWLCRLRFTPTQKILSIPDENKKEVKYQIDNIYDIEQYRDQLIAVLNRYL